MLDLAAPVILLIARPGARHPARSSVDGLRRYLVQRNDRKREVGHSGCEVAELVAELIRRRLTEQP